ncbi:MAG: MFS transporter [Bacteroidales bacterium]|nr:MFS transporter [Bacteroidales bacterium]
MKNYKFLNNIGGWIAFLIAFVTYLLTLEPTSSYWDCGEFIASAYKLEVGHPPGAPFFMLLGRFFSFFAFGDVELVAMWVNVLSALASAFTILFLFWTVTYLAKRILAEPENEPKGANLILVLGAGFVGALTYTFSDTFWFSAVEGEVYALSSFFTAFVFWAILKWESVAEKPGADKWIVLIAYMMGLSIGVHLLNLLAIPAIVFVYYFKKFNINWKGIIAASILSVVLLAVVQYGIIQGLFVVAANFELVFVNSLGLPFYSGLIFFIILLFSTLALGLYFSQFKKNIYLNTAFFTLAAILLGIPFMAHNTLLAVLMIAAIIAAGYFLFKKSAKMLNLALLCFTVILIGYSTFATIMIRSLANPPMDENNPENVFALLDYLNREQYGDRPLFYGQYYTAEAVEYNEGSPKYYPNKETGRYEVYDYKLDIEYSPELQTVFPRMYSSTPSHIKQYESWASVEGSMVSATVKRRDPNTGRIEEMKEPILKPTFRENLSFFFNYQLDHMYFRYFMWNFSGRQNDIQSHGGVFKGNWITGIPAIDNSKIGSEENMPDFMKNNPGNNKYYLLPFILGLLGLVYQFSKNKKDGVIVGLLFFLTGIAIVIYLNQTPLQPRERDYAYAGSFYAFSIWIGLGLLMVYSGLVQFMKKKFASIASTLVCIVLVPIIMANENWDDHNRSARYTARDLAKAYLDSCEPNAILFTMGDNDTFPLWYVQEVEGYRTDVRVVNLSLLGMDWYINQMRNKVYNSDPVPFTMPHKKYMTGTRDLILVEDINRLSEAGAFRTRESAEIVRNLLLGKFYSKNNLVEKYKEIYNELISLLSKSEMPQTKPNDYEKISAGADNFDPFNLDYYLDLLQNEEFVKTFNLKTDEISAISTKNKKLLTDIFKMEMPLKLAMDFVQNDNENTIYPGNEYHYLPSRKLSIPIDKEMIIKKGIVSAKDSARIVDQIIINVPADQRTFQKNFMMVFDLLANYNWERPIYFALTVGSENFLHLHNYLHLEGLALRILPIKSDVPKSVMIQTNKIGSVNANVMYTNIMEKWQYGGMNNPSVYLDENNRSMMMYMKTIFSRLADELIVNGEIEKAIEVLEKANYELPADKTGYSYVDLSLLKSLYLADDFVKAKDLLQKIENQFIAEKKYYMSLDKKFVNIAAEKIKGVEHLLQITGSFAILLGEANPREFITEEKLDYLSMAKDFREISLEYFKLTYPEQEEIIDFLNLTKAVKDIMIGLPEDMKKVFGMDLFSTEKWFFNSEKETLNNFSEYVVKSLGNEDDKLRIANFFSRIIEVRENKEGTNHLKWFVNLNNYQSAMLVEFVIININI